MYPLTQQYILNTYYVSETMVDYEDTMGEQDRDDLFPPRAHSLMRETEKLSRLTIQVYNC